MNDTLFDSAAGRAADQRSPEDGTVDTAVARKTVFFDGACGLCSREISKLRDIVSPGSVKFANIHELGPSELAETFALYDVRGISGEKIGDVSEGLAAIPERHDLLRNLYVIEKHRVRIGLDANIALWEETPYSHWFSLLRLPVIYSLGNWLYTKWAKRRYQKKYEQGITYCELPSKTKLGHPPKARKKMH